VATAEATIAAAAVAVIDFPLLRPYDVNTKTIFGSNKNSTNDDK
jgi:hypothetical protein